MNIITFDTEATDLTPGQICQLSYLMARDDRVTGKNLFFAVDYMGEGAQEVHGLTMDMLEELSEGRRFEDHAKEIFDDFSKADLLVGHNVAADDRYLKVEFDRLGMKLPRIRTFCTMNYFTSDAGLKRKVDIGRPKPPKLSELTDYFGISDDEIAARAQEWFGGGGRLHDARFDTVATWLCLAAGARAGKIRGIL